MAIEIHRTRALAAGFGQNRSHADMNASPTTLRNDSIVSTSQRDAMMILARTSEMPSARAAASPGAEEKTERKATRRKLSDGRWMPEIRGSGGKRNQKASRPASSHLVQAVPIARGRRTAI
jgi:hypothetical protein